MDGDTEREGRLIVHDVLAFEDPAPCRGVEAC